MAVAWPLVRSHLASALPGVVGTSVTVYDGPVLDGGTPTTYLSIAAQPSTVDGSSGTFTQQVGPDGFSAEETGTVRCELGGVTGDTTVPDVFGTFGAIASYLQGDQTLGGVLQPASTVTASVDDVIEAQTRAGAVQRLLISIQYTTRLA